MLDQWLLQFHRAFIIHYKSEQISNQCMLIIWFFFFLNIRTVIQFSWNLPFLSCISFRISKQYVYITLWYQSNSHQKGARKTINWLLSISIVQESSSKLHACIVCEAGCFENLRKNYRWSLTVAVSDKVLKISKRNLLPTLSTSQNDLCIRES